MSQKQLVKAFTTMEKLFYNKKSSQSYTSNLNLYLNRTRKNHYKPIKKADELTDLKKS
jgi:hypothetical protein